MKRAQWNKAYLMNVITSDENFYLSFVFIGNGIPGNAWTEYGGNRQGAFVGLYRT